MNTHPATTDNVAAIHERPVELLQKLVRFDTTNPPGNEAACIGYIDEVLSGAGFETRILARNDARPNLVTRLAGQGQAAPLLMYGHVDVVTTQGQAWTHPPFAAEIADGCIWGRGTLDMKGAVAMMMAALMRAKAENLRPPGLGFWRLAHATDERIPVEALEFGVDAIYKLMQRFDEAT